jgi:hypothetical protein
VIDSAGKVGIGSGSLTPTGTLDVSSIGSNVKTAILRGRQDQTANILEVSRGTGIPVFTVAPLSSVVTITDDGYYPTLNFKALWTTTKSTIMGYDGMMIDINSNERFTVRDGSSNNIFQLNPSASQSWIKHPLSVSTAYIAGAQITAQPATTSTKGIVVQGNASQTANLFEVQNSAGSPILAITPSGSISGAISPTIITATGGLTLTNVHHGYIIEQTGVVSSGTFTIGSTSEITIPGWNCMLVNIGSGVIVASGTGNTMRSPGFLNRSRTQFSSISIYRRGNGDYVLGGDLA